MTDSMSRIPDLRNLAERTLICVDCGKDFIFSIGEQRYFRSKGLIDPKRCPQCREWRRATLLPEVQ